MRSLSTYKTRFLGVVIASLIRLVFLVHFARSNSQKKYYISNLNLKSLKLKYITAVYAI
jgi:hypothetical protein